MKIAIDDRRLQATYRAAFISGFGIGIPRAIEHKAYLMAAAFVVIGLLNNPFTERNIKWRYRPNWEKGVLLTMAVLVIVSIIFGL